MEPQFLSAKATVSSKGQVVIPALLREAAGIHEGTELLFTMQPDGTLQAVSTQQHSAFDFIALGKKLSPKNKMPKKYAGDDAAIGAMLLAEDARTKTKPRHK